MISPPTKVIVSLMNVTFKLYANIILRRPFSFRKHRGLHYQACLQTSRVGIVHVFSARRMLEQRHVLDRSMFSAFHNLAAEFNSVVHALMWNRMMLLRNPLFFVNRFTRISDAESGRIPMFHLRSSRLVLFVIFVHFHLSVLE